MRNTYRFFSVVTFSKDTSIVRGWKIIFGNYCTFDRRTNNKSKKDKSLVTIHTLSVDG